MNIDEIVKLSNNTISGVFDEIAAHYPNKEAFVFQEDRVTYEKAQRYVNALANGLLKLGVEKGDKVAVWMTNNLEWVYSAFAIWKIGAVLVTVSTRFKSEEAAYNLHQSDVTTLILKDNFLGKTNVLEMLKEVIPEVSTCERGNLKSANLPLLKNIICVGETRLTGMYPFNEIMELGDERTGDSKLEEAAPSISPDDVCTHLYTSGTTGRPKASLGCHRGWLANFNVLTSHHLQLTKNDKVLGPLPFFGGMGLAQIPGTMLIGATLFILESFDSEKAINLIQRERITAGYIVVPSLYGMMLDHPKFTKDDVFSLKRTLLSGMPATHDFIKLLHDNMGMERVLDHYAMIETHGSGTTTVPTISQEKLITTEGTVVGYPDPHIQIKIVDFNTRKELPSGKDGEVCLKAIPSEIKLSLGYYKMEEATAKLIDEDGWVHMSDIGHIREKDGVLVLTGRVSDMFIVGGFNVYPVEIETILLRHPQVKRVAVIGVPDRRLGEVCMAFIQLKEGEICSEAEIIDFCKNKLANIKVPKYVKIVSEFPLAAQDKIRKFDLRKMAIKELGL